MNDRTLRVLEFDKVVSLLNDETETSIGKKLSTQLTPKTSIEDVQALLDETDEAVHILRLNKIPPFGGIFNIEENIERAKLGGILRTIDCLNVATTIYGGKQLKRFIENIEEEIPLLKEEVETIEMLTELERFITFRIDENGRIVDSATDKLRSIRSSINSYERQIRERLERLTRTKSKMLSDSIVTIRNDRYVLPVKHEYRSAIGGIVHDQSASGQTLFIEPQAVVELNNKLQEMNVEEKHEIEKILRQMTEQIAIYSNELLNNIKIIANLDFIFARGRLGQKMKAAMPTLNDDGYIKITQARHPLIPINEVVANDVEIGKDYTAIVITGPNTGGKTVTLKMIGLFILMVQSGLHIPALDGCEISLFNKVYADIGDEQSIEQNLSTFSSHMTNIVDIMKQVDHKTLVLFDELGAGTDPQEGAALAMSLLDDVISRDARVIATTHYPELKAYGYNRENVMNASVEFDVETLQPTYRLIMGVPGRSNAFEISSRLGLNDQLIEHAKGYLGIDSKNVESMIRALEDSKKEAERQYEEAKEFVRESEQIKKELNTAWKQYNEMKERLYKDAEAKAEKALQQAREEAEIIVQQVREMKDQTMWKEHEWIEARKLLDDAQPQLSETEEKVEQVKSNSLPELAVGDDVRLTSLNQDGTILEKIKDNEYIVQVGMIRLNAKRKDMKQIRQQKEERAVPTIRMSGGHVKTELDLRGERYEDGLIKVEKYIDDALVAGYSQVSIIHGKGTGVLRKGVQNYLKSHPNVASYRLGEANEGGSGVTVAKLN